MSDADTMNILGFQLDSGSDSEGADINPLAASPVDTVELFEQLKRKSAMTVDRKMKTRFCILMPPLGPAFSLS